MLFMIIVKASVNSEKGLLPSEELMKQMDEYNGLLEEAGVRVMAKGLHPSNEGVRLSFKKDKDKPEISYGPFYPASEVVAGFFLIEVESKEEAMEWLLKVPDPQGNGEGIIELREVF